VLISVAEEPQVGTAALPGTRRVFFVVEPNRTELAELARWIDAGKLRPIIGQVLPLANGHTAFEAKRRGGVAGKIVLAVTDE
jgi:NADPH:quinone reductase-like Zn-dependent oxidoreductase